MCRLFAFRSIIPSQVHQSLLHAENGLCELSLDHPDGWGVSYYIEGAPHVVKSENAAFDDHIFRRVSGVVASQTVLAHIRKATLGNQSILNTHPFQYGRWVFAHNGNIKNWKKHKDDLRRLVSLPLSRYILGDTDSETLFFIFLTELFNEHQSLTKGLTAEQLIEGCQKALDKIRAIVGPYLTQDDGPPSETYLTFILTNGSSIVGFQGGKNLYYSTYKTLCHESKTCSYFEASCHAPSEDGTVNHLILSSAPIDGENIWHPLAPGDFVASDDLRHPHKISMIYKKKAL
ncbi:MAG: class II glutamine amidotransferase [Bdellovibrionales bacterium]|nr:class II glutamine amidotransferase [Bdellovibrionales bacterium]